MKRLLFLSIVLFLSVVPALAQGTNFSGTWVLDLSKSKPDERSRITEQTITVTHSGMDFKRDTVSKRSIPPGGGPGMGGRGGFGGGDGVENLTLDGKEVRSQVESQMGPTQMSKKAEVKNGSLHIATTRTIGTQMGEITFVTREEWILSSDGKTLTINNTVETPRGNMTSMMFYNKN